MEATIVCIDNSEWTRNGDYYPDRFQAQADAITLLAGSKMQEHPENGVGVLTMAGKAPQVMVTPTSDLTKVLNCMAELTITGEVSNICASVQVAQLALKHRSNKNQRQRIVLFNGSPVSENKVTSASLELLAKTARKLKKNNVSIDVVCFGSGEESVEKLRDFVTAVDSYESCNFVEVPAGTGLSDHLMRSTIFQGENSGNFGAGTSINPEGDFNVDPSIDPDLALALRISMEEERERLSRAAAAASGDAASSTPMETNTAATVPNESMTEDVDKSLLEAIALSMQEVNNETTATGASTSTATDTKKGDALEQSELEAALQQSLQSQHGSSDSTIDPEMLNAVLASLPGVDPNSPDVQRAIQNLARSAQSGPKESEKKSDDNPQQDKGDDGQS